jgi:hypothetical protein
MGVLTRLYGVAAVLLTIWALQGAIGPARSAADEPCPDVEAVFARGTAEAPGAGPVGDAFVNALRSKLGARSLGVYAVNYPATDDWPTGIDGIRDAAAHIQSTMASCPDTKMVLGGYSQGAAVMGFTTANAIPDGFDGDGVPRPMPPEVAGHVPAVVLFGTPNARAMNFLNQPPVAIGPLYAGKTIQLCTPEDAVCSEGLDFGAHNPDAYDGIIDEGASYAASRL